MYSIITQQNSGNFRSVLVLILGNQRGHSCSGQSAIEMTPVGPDSNLVLELTTETSVLI